MRKRNKALDDVFAKSNLDELRAIVAHAPKDHIKTAQAVGYSGANLGPAGAVAETNPTMGRVETDSPGQLGGNTLADPNQASPKMIPVVNAIDRIIEIFSGTQKEDEDEGYKTYLDFANQFKELGPDFEKHVGTLMNMARDEAKHGNELGRIVESLREARGNIFKNT